MSIYPCRYFYASSYMKVNRFKNAYTLMLQIGELWISSRGSQSLGIEADSYTGQKNPGQNQE